jgi:two-component system, response regulator YesN
MNSNKKHFFTKILSSLTILIVTTIFAISTLLYFNFEKILSENIESSSVKSLSHISYSAQIMIDTAKQMSIQLYFNNEASRLLNYTNLNTQETFKAMSSISHFFYTIPYTESIYFYNRSARTVYGNRHYTFENFPDQELLEIIDLYTEYEQLSPIPRQLDFIASSSQLIKSIHNVFTFLFYGEPNLYAPPKSAIIINFSEAWIRNIINSMNLDSTNDIFILDKNNTVVLTNSYYKIFDNISYENYVQEIVTSQDTKGSIITKINGTKHLIVYVKSEDIPWTFIQIIDYNTITESINHMRLITLLVGFSILFIGLIMSYIASKRLYVPINHIIVRSGQLELEKRKNFLTIKQDLLSKLLKHDQLYNSKLLLDKFNTSSIAFDIQSPLLLIIFRIDHYRDFLNMYDADDRELYKFAIMNIIQELFSEHFTKNDIVDLGDNQLVLFLNYGKDQYSSLHNQIESIASKAQATAKELYQLSLSITVSSLNKKNEALSLIYKETEEISSNGAFIGYESMLFYDDIHLKNSESYIYPTHQEKTLIEFVLLGKVDEAVKIYHDIVDKTIDFPFFIYEMVISRLSFSFKAAIMDTIEIQEIGNPSTLFSSLNEIELKSDVDDFFCKLFTEIHAIILLKEKKTKNLRHQEFIQKVIEVIENNYKDPNISVESIAMELNMSSAYLGRVFKQSTSTSVADYILDLRMNYAKELLRTTDASINDIAIKIGILNANYFYTKFKKLYGMTPTEFKKLN